MIVQFSAIVDNITKKKDNTLSIKLGTQEINDLDELARLFSYGNKQIWVAFAETDLTREDLNIPEVVSDLKKKTDSQRLRDRMYIYYNQIYPNETNFNQWYTDALEKIGQSYLDKLN